MLHVELFSLKIFQIDEGDLVSKIIKQGSSTTGLEAESFESDDDTNPAPEEIENVGSESEKDFLLHPTKIKEIIDQVTANITGTLQTLVVSDRVVAAERNSDDWKQLCQLMANNPEIINNRMAIAGSPTQALRQIGPDFSNLSKVKRGCVE